uniref:Uncharacterized protein n=1 Tax=uncultured bacterium pAM1 TaxID=1781153 RepID=A0A1C9U4V9_9BACT|nr:hypothetical protein [uncultured bacterium pAM1]
MPKTIKDYGEFKPICIDVFALLKSDIRVFLKMRKLIRITQLSEHSE